MYAKSRGRYHTQRRIHAVWVSDVTLIVPEPTQIMLSTVFIPQILIFVVRGELHGVVFR